MSLYSHDFLPVSILLLAQTRPALYNAELKHAPHQPEIECFGVDRKMSPEKSSHAVIIEKHFPPIIFINYYLGFIKNFIIQWV